MTSPLKRFLYGLLVIMLSLNAWIVVAAETPNDQKDEVIVTATRTKQEQKETPGTTEVITKDEIKNSGAVTAADVLKENGFVISTNGGAANVATVQLDGFSAGQTLVLINGIPANSGSSGVVDLSYYPVSGIQKIEIVHGPLSALYGSNALGGVVNIITDLTGDPGNSILFSGGSFTTRQTEITVQQRKFGFTAGGLTTDSYRERSEANLGHLMAQYDFYQNETGFLTLDLNLRMKDSQSPGSLTYHPVADEYAKTAEFDLRGQTHRGGWFLDYKAFSQYIDYRYDELDVPPARYQTKTFGLDFAGQHALVGHQLLSGFTLRHDDFKGTSTGNHTLDNGALFLQDEWKISGQWQLVSGLRWDTGSVFSSPVSPRMSLIHQVSEELTLKFGYGKAFRAPTVNDLYYPEDSWGMIGNPDLLPERSERYEITGEWKAGSHLWSVNVFKADVKDGISWEFDGTHFKPINIEKMQVNGVTLSWQKSINGTVDTGIRYSWIDKLGWNSTTGTYSDDANYFGSGQLTYNLSFKYKQWNGGLDWHRVVKRAAQYGTAMPDYQFLNLNLGYQANAALTYKLTLNNIFDEAYQIHSGYPMPGREIIFTINTNF